VFPLTITLQSEATTPFGEITIQVRNQANGQLFEAKADTDGHAHFDALPAGFYSLSAYGGGYNGYEQIELFKASNTKLPLVKGLLGKLIISQVYFSGSATASGKLYYADQFIEIHNNSTETQYADGLSILIHASYGRSENPYAYMANDSVAINLCYTIPGSGKEYPVKPGQSFIIAQDAFDHKSHSLGNPNSPIDLGQAQFEFYATKYPGKDVDYPAINMMPNLFSYVGTDVLVNTMGGHAVALARFEEEINPFLAKNMINTKLAKVPNKWIEDAVEIMPIGKNYKRFSNELDAGMVTVGGGLKCGLGIRRKVVNDQEAGKIFYQDTNNSSNDFLHDIIPVVPNE
jgi:hypothetical protein